MEDNHQIQEVKQMLIEELRDFSRNLDLPKFYSWLKECGIGFTPLVRLPKSVNPYHNDVAIYAKLEYTNYAESIKARPFATMYYIKMLTGKVGTNKKIVAATSGNFGLAGSYLLRHKSDFTVYMSEIAAEENKGLTSKLQRNEANIETFPDRYCPTVSAKRGMAIAAARSMQQIDSEVVNFDQYDDASNPLAHFLTTGPEIISQTKRKVTHFVTSLGTCGTFVGCGHALRERIPAVKLVGLVPQENHHQLGLRSKDELGAARFFEEAKNLSNQILKIEDADAYNTLLSLWNNDIPAGISSGTNCYGALKVAQQISDKRSTGLIVTVLPDSCENYEEFLRLHFHNIMGRDFGSFSKEFEELKIKARKQREKHILSLKRQIQVEA